MFAGVNRTNHYDRSLHQSQWDSREPRGSLTRTGGAVAQLLVGFSLSQSLQSTHSSPALRGMRPQFSLISLNKKQRKIFYNSSARGQNKITVKFEITGLRG